MPRKSLTQDGCQDAILTLLQNHLGVAHCDDVGPLFGQLATLLDRYEEQEAVQETLASAISAALGSDPRPLVYRRVEWTEAVRLSDNVRAREQHGLRAPVGVPRLLARGLARRGPR